jgi:carbamoyl-phosphate synthase small subunit
VSAPTRREAAYVLLEDGTRFDGEAVGAPGPVTGEVVFTTGMSGYQESMTDPSFARQLITFTVPHVGNYGVSADGMESDRIHAAAAIMREAVDDHDAPGADQGWIEWLTANGIPGISGSTRARSCATSATPGRCAAGSSTPASPSRGARADRRRARR